MPLKQPHTPLYLLGAPSAPDASYTPSGLSTKNPYQPHTSLTPLHPQNGPYTPRSPLMPLYPSGLWVPRVPASPPIHPWHSLMPPKWPPTPLGTPQCPLMSSIPFWPWVPTIPASPQYIPDIPTSPVNLRMPPIPLVFYCHHVQLLSLCNWPSSYS